MGGLHSFGGGLDELSHVILVGDRRHVAGRDFDGDGPQPGRRRDQRLTVLEYRCRLGPVLIAAAVV
jgi:hypothetical protein